MVFAIPGIVLVFEPRHVLCLNCTGTVSVHHATPGMQPAFLSRGATTYSSSHRLDVAPNPTFEAPNPTFEAGHDSRATTHGSMLPLFHALLALFHVLLQ